MANFTAHTQFDAANIIELGNENENINPLDRELIREGARVTGATISDMHGHTVTIRGNGIALNSNGFIKAGKINDVTQSNDGHDYFSVSGLNHNLNVNYYDAGYKVDGQTIYGFQAETAYWLNGNDTITGSSEGDVLAGYAGNDTINGGDGNDSLEGWSGNDVLNGQSGADEMIGGKGNDTYYVDNSDDVVVESNAQGTDIVYASADFTLSDNVENLTLQGTAIEGVGNSLANKIVGNDLANILDGGAGNDTISAGGGNDWILGGLGNDKIDGGLGADTVSYQDAAAGVSINLAKGKVTGGAGNDTLTNIENADGSEFNDTVVGSALENTLEGNGGNDTINGGLGADTLAGGDGADSFVFDTALGSTNIDTISDFTSGTDKIVLDDDVFKKLSGTKSGVALSSDNFVVGDQAQDANDFLVYNQDNHTLYYDADGSGAGAMQAVAVIELTGAAPSASDFLIVS